MNEIFLFNSKDFPGILDDVNVISLWEKRGTKESLNIFLFGKTGMQVYE